MLRPLPNWFYGLLPQNLWPDRPREFYAYTVSVIPLVANTTLVTDVVFSKKTDSIIFGGQMIRTAVAGDSFFNPRAGTTVRALVQLSNSASNEQYTDGQVPIENIFSSWGSVIMGPAGFVNAGAKLPCFWPLPITVLKGGALTMRLTDLAGVASHFRFTFWGALVYKQSEREAA